jgi:hypothetical protein
VPPVEQRQANEDTMAKDAVDMEQQCHRLSSVHSYRGFKNTCTSETVLTKSNKTKLHNIKANLLSLILIAFLVP